MFAEDWRRTCSPPARASARTAAVRALPPNRPLPARRRNPGCAGRSAPERVATTDAPAGPAGLRCPVRSSRSDCRSAAPSRPASRRVAAYRRAQRCVAGRPGHPSPQWRLSLFSTPQLELSVTRGRITLIHGLFLDLRNRQIGCSRSPGGGWLHGEGAHSGQLWDESLAHYRRMACHRAVTSGMSTRVRPSLLRKLRLFAVEFALGIRNSGIFTRKIRSNSTSNSMIGGQDVDEALPIAPVRGIDRPQRT